MQSPMENRRIVLINGGSTSWFDQAIFIVNDPMHSKPTPDIVAQAERIINNITPPALVKATPQFPANQALARRASPKRDSFDTWLNIIMIASCVALAAILISQL